MQESIEAIIRISKEDRTVRTSSNQLKAIPDKKMKIRVPFKKAEILVGKLKEQEEQINGQIRERETLVNVENEKIKKSDEKMLIKEHGKVLFSFISLFLGFVTAFSLWYIILPDATVTTLFQIQTNTIASINSPTTGKFLGLSSTIGIIFLNNIKVLFFCLLFAFFYGFGAIFILTWNASVLATVIGAFIKANAGNMILAPLVLLRYALHGIPEIAAYFMAGLAGGIISIALIRHDFGTDKFKHILTDSLDLIILAIVTLVGAALIEVFISPLVL